ncbi:MAG: DUF4342 domain-containing protein [Anaerolineae bacterium]|nr:DUF4342 domain-containing protein [Anaerolineae bacterium]
MAEEEVPAAEESRKAKQPDLFEELTVAGNQLVKEVQRLIDEGNVRRLIIKQDDKVLMEVNLTLSVLGGAVLSLFAPMSAVILAAVAAVAAAVAKVTVVIERIDEPDVVDDVEDAVENAVEKLSE